VDYADDCIAYVDRISFINDKMKTETDGLELLRLTGLSHFKKVENTDETAGFHKESEFDIHFK
jgi:hypothetical protein